MKYVLVLFLALSWSACEQSNSGKAPAETAAAPAPAIDAAAKQFLIDITNLSWFQAQIAQAALKKSTDTAILSLAQGISKQYLRIKDKAKIVSIPYQIDMPYFLTHDQNDEVNQLASLDAAAFNAQFLEKIKHNNDVILEKCAGFQTAAPIDNSFQQLISFCKTTVENNTPK